MYSSRNKSALTESQKQNNLRRAYTIRRFEEKLLSLFAEGKIGGTVHTCIGQEFTGVALGEWVQSGDIFFSNHRGHGHYLGINNKLAELFAEVMGKSLGVSGGIGGSQHLYDTNFLSNGIQGGMVPVAAGYALSRKLSGKKQISVVFVGDGTMGEGALYEALNYSSKWNLPVLVVVENNGIAQTTPVEMGIAGSIQKRAEAFGIAYTKLNTRNWERLVCESEDIIRYVREECRPFVLEVETYRLRSHSKGDDTRPEAEVEKLRELDPLNLYLASGAPEIAELKDSVELEINSAVEQAEASDYLKYPGRTESKHVPLNWQSSTFESQRYVKLINESFKTAMRADESICFLGEDILSPYGGAFKVANDLSHEFPERVFSTPISEAGIIGLGNGLAFGGLRPIVEIMFGDFLALGFDQLLNHASKFPSMYNTELPLPLVVRTPMGGYRGYGPTHSQSIEKHFLGIPNLDVLALNVRTCPKQIYGTLLTQGQTPTLVVENKILYTKFLRTEAIPGYAVEYSDELFPTVRIRPNTNKANLTVFCYGGMLEMVEDCLIEAFEEEEVFCEVICPTRLSPLNPSAVVESVRGTGCLLTIEEGPTFAAAASELVTQIVESGTPIRNLKRVGNDTIIPTSTVLEAGVLPSKESILKAMIEVARV